MTIFSHDGSSSNHTCPMPSNLKSTPNQDFISGYTFQQFNMILSGACTAFVLICIFGLILMHATHFSRPSEQGKIMRICWVIAIYAGFSWVSTAVPNAYIYLEPWCEYFQAIALGSFFLLMCDFVSPNDMQRENYFAPLQIQSKKQSKSPQNGLTWYRRKWVFIFQYPVITFAVAIATAITQAAKIYCLESSKPYFAHLWLQIISTVSLIMAVLAVLTFYGQLKTDLKHHKPLAKLLAFKLLIALTFVEKIIFWALRSTNVLKESATLTYADVNMGIPTMVICIEMIPFAIFFWYAYSFKPYLLSHSRPLAAIETAGTEYQGKLADEHRYPVNGTSYQGGFLGLRALLDVMNPMDTLHAIKFAISMAAQMRRQTSQPE